jgi:hypothetical protein
MVICETPLIRFNEPRGTFLVYYLIGFDFAGPIGPFFFTFYLYLQNPDQSRSGSI